MANIVSTKRALHTPEYHSKLILRQRRFKIVILIAAIVIIAGIIALARLERFAISSINTEGNLVTRDEEILAAATEVLNGNYLYVFPRRNFLIYPKGEVAAALKAAIPRLKDIEIETDYNPTALNVSVTERLPHGLFCPTSQITFEDIKSCYFLDKSGFIFAAAPNFSGEAYFIYADETLTAPLGIQFLNPEEFYELNTFVSALKELGIMTKGLQVTHPNGRVGYSLILTGGGELFWNADQPLDLLLSNLETFVASETVLNDESFWSNVSYVDLRTGDKIFYKFR